MPSAKGRPRYAPSPLKAVEKLSSDEVEHIRNLRKLRLDHAIDIVLDLDAHWLAVARDRLALAAVHYECARALVGSGTPGKINDLHRGAISRAYYAMYCAARAAYAHETYGDVDEHREVATKIQKTQLGTPQERDRVTSALNKYRALRNEADYSPYYPAPLGRDAKNALREAKAVVRIARRWVKLRAVARGLKL